MQASVKQDRRKWIGGSDTPIIMGISPFTTRYELLLYKAGIKDIEFNGNEYTEYGNKMESKIRDYVNELYKRNFVEGKHEIEELGFRLHTDGEDDKTILEIKTTSQMHDELDDYKIYLVQLLFYMMNTDKEQGILAIYNRPEDFSEEFDPSRLQVFTLTTTDYDDLCNTIVKEVERFKEDIERLKDNPLLTEEDLMPMPIRELSHEILLIEEQLKSYKELEKRQKELKEKLYTAMLENNIKKWETPNGVKITLVESIPDKTEMVFNENKFKEEQPIVYASYCEETTKKGKAGYIRIS